MSKGTDAASYGIAGASLGSSFGPWGTLVGGVGGTVYGLVTGGDGAPRAYYPDPKNYRSPTTQVDGGGNPIPGTQWGVGKFWSDKANEYIRDPQRKSVEAARAQQQMAMNNMYNRATGGPSLAGAQANMQGQQLMGQAHGAVGGGGMGARRAMVASGAAGQGIANSAMMSEQKERLAALGAYQKGAQSYFGAEADTFGREAAHKAAQSDLYQNFIGQGLADKSAQAQSRLRYEQTKMKAHAAQAKIDAAQNSQNKQFAGEIIRTIPKVIPRSG